MKRILSSLAFSLLLVTTLFGNDSAWSTDYDAALAKAKSEKKLVLMDFTGSDWCGWCIKLDKEVFGKKEFKDYATNNLILVVLDFPRRKAQSAKIKEQNKKLSDTFQIKGFPTVVVLDSEGRKVGELGYMEGGPKAFIAELEKLKK